MNRRQFLGNSTKHIALLNLAALAPAGLMAGQVKQVQPGSFIDPAAPPIKYRTLGRTNIQVPLVNMGVMNASVPNVVKQAYLKGMRLFDTAWFYQNGRNETMVGDVIKELGVRDQVSICTKVFLKEIKRDLYSPEIKKLFLERFDESLKRLKMDYVDILLYHAAENLQEFNNPYIIEAFDELKKAKKIRFAGVSLHGDDAAMLDDMVKTGYYDIAMVIINVALANDERLITSMQNAAKSGIGLIAMKTQCGDGGYMWWNRKNAPENEQKYNLNQTALLKWVLNLPFISTAIPGFTTFEQLDENFSANLDIELNSEESEFLEVNQVNLARSFCTQCSQCISTCPNKVDIPNLNRTWMYAFQYRNMEQAHITAQTLGNHGMDKCVSCAKCEAVCGKGIQISRRIEALREIGLQYS